jgi:hypothetical protein
MLEPRFEDLIRQTLRDEASALPVSVTLDVLERRLADRRRARGTRQRWVGVAAATVLAVGATAGIASWVQDHPSVTSTPLPSVSTPLSPTLPDSSELLTAFPEALILLDAADGPIAGQASPDPAASPVTVDAGTVTFDGPFVIGIACIGGGEMVAEVRTPSFGDVPYTSAVAECDGTPTTSTYAAPPIDPDSPGDTVTVVIPPGRAWRLAIGQLPTSLIEPPDLAPIALTDGWNLLADIPAVQLNDEQPRTGSRLAVPAGSSRLGLLVQCAGTGSVSVSIDAVPVSDVACDAQGETQRLEAPVTGGEVVSLEAGGAPGAWVRMVVETDAPIATVYADAPPLPDDVAAAVYVAPDANVVGFGSVGGSKQTILPLSGRPGQPSGDLLPISQSNETGAALHLASVSRGEVLRTLVDAPAPAVIIDSWADAANGRVYYALALAAGIEFRSIGVDGSDDQLHATVARDALAGFTAELARDGSAFVVDACHEGAGCRRTTVEPSSGDSRTVDRPDEPVCRILGIVGGTIIGTTRARCTEPSPTSLVAIPRKGETRLLLEDAPQEAADGIVVDGTDGPKVVYAGTIADDGGVTLKILDVTTGTTTDLPPGDVGDPRQWPQASTLPGSWVLLAAGLGDFPWQRAFDRPVPVVLNVVTGERVELPNLPHWVGFFTTP